MKQRLGYTLVELMIVISIVAILITFGVSAYGKARDRQIGQAAGETIVRVMQENQKTAGIGKKDCVGKFIGQRVITSAPNIITSQSICESGDGILIETKIPNINSITTATITFRPLSLGITLPNDPFNIDIVSSNLTTYRVQLNSSGTIEYKGLQQL